MRAVACQKRSLDVIDLPAPVPGVGHVVLDVVRCGICGSDLHARHHADELADVVAEVGYPDFMRAEHQVVMGHEFSGTVSSYGRRTRRRVDTGAPVVAMPLIRMNGQGHALGLAAAAPGASAEQGVAEESFMFPVADGFDPVRAALAEPMAIAWHAVRRGDVKK